MKMNDRFPMGTTIEAGIRVFRNETEVVETDGLKRDDLPEHMRPVTLVDFGGMTLEKVLKTAANISVIQTQKAVRGLSPGQIEKWREAQFNANEPGIIKIDAASSATSLEIPLTPEDIVEKIMAKAPMLFEGKSEEEKLKIAPMLYEAMKEMLGK